MREFVPVPGTAKARLIEAALRDFADRGYDSVGVTEIAAAAGVTVGSLYHHFGSKAGLYSAIRSDVERRLLDRMEGAWAAAADLPGALGIGFDYLVRAGFRGLLAEPAQEGSSEPVEAFIAGHSSVQSSAAGSLLAATWRAALAHGDPTAAREALLSIAR
jgi:AcrR family transcriptional regulator